MTACPLFFILLASVHAIELARHELQSLSWGWRLEEDPADLVYDFRWKVGKLSSGNHITWRGVNRRVGETITLNQDNYGPTFNLFTRLLTDGKDYISWFEFVQDSGSTGSGQMESFVFGNETGSNNEIDLQGNYIESVAVTFDAFDLVPNGADWIDLTLDLTLVVEGRTKRPGDRDLAILTDDDYGFYCPDADYCNSTVWFTVQEPVEEPLWWAGLEFVFELNKTQEGGMFSSVAEYGNRPIQQMLTSGADGSVIVGNRRYDHISTVYRKSKSLKFRGLPGVFNGVDFEGNLVEDVSLAVEREQHNVLQFSFVISGVLLEAPPDPTQAPTDPPDSSDSSTWAALCLTKVVAWVLALLVGWPYY